MRLITLTYLLCLSLFLGFFSNYGYSLEESLNLKEVFLRISPSDLENLNSYLAQNTNYYKGSNQEKILTIISDVISKKSLDKNSYITITNHTDQEEQAFAYRQERLRDILRKIFHTDININEKGDLILSNKVPIIYDNKTDQFSLRKFTYPSLSSTFKDSPTLKIYEEALNYPNYDVLQWNAVLKEYDIYLPELEKSFKINEILTLPNDHLIMTFMNLFPVANQKPVWAWRIFGTTSMKKAIINLLKREKKSYLN